MSVLVWVILLVLLAGVILKYEKTLVAVIPFFPFLSIFRLPFGNFDTISLFDFLAFIVCLLFPFYNGKKKKRKVYPFVFVIIITAISSFLSNFKGIEKHYIFTVSQIVSNMICPLILYKYLCDNIKNQKLFFRSLTIFLFMLISYGLIELVIRENPFIGAGVKSDSFLPCVMFQHDQRFGFKRLQSLLAMHTAFGYVLSVCFLIYFYVKPNFKKITYFDYIIAVICVLEIVATGCRSIYCGFVVGLLMFSEYFKKNMLKYCLALMLLIPVIISMPIFNDIVESIVNTDKVGGSNSDMRLGQLEATLFYFMHNPIFGNGPSYTFTNVVHDSPEIQGAESVWFILLIEYGLVGVLVYIFSLIAPVIYFIKNKMTSLVGFILFVLICSSMTSLPGMAIYSFYFYLVYFIVVKKTIINGKSLNHTTSL
ncbi:MAG: O-antigen ligase family protein [Paludibacteraceae bacterium]|nr:O-antigen ligase family protein [Paludibacteraceae bacterium]